MTKKLFAIAVSATFLLPQAVEVVHPSNGWYWPFLDYPMYSVSQPAGREYLHYALRLVRCDVSGDYEEMDFVDMGVTYFEFQQRLSRAADLEYDWTPSQVEGSKAALSEIALGRADGEACTAEVWVRRHHIEDGQGLQVSDWERAVAWAIRPTPAGPRNGVEE